MPTNTKKLKSKKNKEIRHPELVEQLAEFGLDRDEARVYTVLLERGRPTGGTKIALASGISRQYVYKTLEKLIILGLVVPIKQGVRSSYKAAPPSTLEKIARKKLGKVNDLVESLGKISTLDHEQDFEIIIGEKAIREYQLDFVLNAVEGETQYIVGGSAPEFMAAIGDDYPQMLRDQEKKKFVTYYLGHKDESTAVSPYKQSTVTFNAKFIDGIPAKLPQFTVRRNTVELYSFFNPPILYVIKSPEVAAKFKIFFQSLWERYA